MFLVSFSEHKEGALCKICILCSNDFFGSPHQKLGALIKILFTKWKHANELFNQRLKCECHKLSTMRPEILQH